MNKSDLYWSLWVANSFSLQNSQIEKKTRKKIEKKLERNGKKKNGRSDLLRFHPSVRRHLDTILEENAVGLHLPDGLHPSRSETQDIRHPPFWEGCLVWITQTSGVYYRNNPESTSNFGVEIKMGRPTGEQIFFYALVVAFHYFQSSTELLKCLRSIITFVFDQVMLLKMFAPRAPKLVFSSSSRYPLATSETIFEPLKPIQMMVETPIPR